MKIKGTRPALTQFRKRGAGVASFLFSSGKDFYQTF